MRPPLIAAELLIAAMILGYVPQRHNGIIAVRICAFRRSRIRSKQLTGLDQHAVVAIAALDCLFRSWLAGVGVSSGIRERPFAAA